MKNVFVPCDGCTLCCRGDAISIHLELGDDTSRYQTLPHYIPELAEKGVVMLAHNPDRSCIYLGADGCTIHGDAPALCREFDCRRLVKDMGYTKARKAAKKGLLKPGIVTRGLNLIPTLNDF
ncbi:YkgJ family cysteine cluster protein [Serratia rhizosphaerae]